jgi:hypothetical protein
MKRELTFSADAETQKVGHLMQELLTHVLHDEQPLFISDGATLWSVSMSDPAEVLQRLNSYYGTAVTMEETQQPLWRLLLDLDQRRTTALPATTRSSAVKFFRE